MALAPSAPDRALPPVRVNLFSDTQSRPTPAMRAAMAAAEVGDEQRGEDPTINALCERMAALLGKEAAMFLPSGTMCNEIAILTHCRPGDEILAHEASHIATSEGGAPWALAGARVLGLPGARGIFTAAALEAAFTSRAYRYAAPQTLVAVEQTANFGGGSLWQLAELEAVADLAHAAGLATHMDGARLLNAVVASGVAAATMAAPFDSVWLDFTKGLGAPIGAVLAGSAAFIDAAWRWKQRLGGAFRQGGIAAAGCLYALDHHIARLAEDHANAAHLAAGLAAIPGITVETPETNLVFFTLTNGIAIETLAARLRARGILISVFGHGRGRAGLHLDITRADVELAIESFRIAVEGVEGLTADGRND